MQAALYTADIPSACWLCQRASACLSYGFAEDCSASKHPTCASWVSANCPNSNASNQSSSR